MAKTPRSKLKTAQKTPKPWDAPPSATVGDSREEMTFAAVGRALTNWEQFEQRLGGIFMALVGTNSYEAMRAFGTVMSNRGRIEMVSAASEAFFLKRQTPEQQALKKRLNEFLATAGQHAARRNEIAHGLVTIMLGEDLDDFSDASYVLVPSYYAKTKRTIAELTGSSLLAFPATYQYSSVEILELNKRFAALHTPAGALALAIRRERNLKRS